jgi:GT2 family glycosyltransferase
VAYDYKRAYDPAKADATFFSAVACAFRRELWEKHPFREQGYAEDAAWARECSEAGACLRLVVDSVVEHSHSYTLKGLFQKHYRQAVTFAEIGAFRPNLGSQAYVCIREILRDILYACRRLQPHTIPYNMAYRVAIHAGLYKGLRNGCRQEGRL